MCKTTAQKQQGVSLLVIIIVILLTMLLALWGARSALFNELIVGTDADYQRAFEAAQTMLQDAEQDIRISTQGSNSRRASPTLNFPTDPNDLDELINQLDSKSPVFCQHAICQPRTGAQDFWNNKDLMTNMTKVESGISTVGARYGQYTGADAGAKSNPILADRDANRGAWYWIEVMKYNPSNSNAGIVTGIQTDPVNAPFLYRITAIARGLKPATQVVLESVIAFPSTKGEAQ